MSFFAAIPPYLTKPRNEWTEADQADWSEYQIVRRAAIKSGHALPVYDDAPATEIAMLIEASDAPESTGDDFCPACDAGLLMPCTCKNLLAPPLSEEDYRALVVECDDCDGHFGDGWSTCTCQSPMHLLLSRALT